MGAVRSKTAMQAALSGVLRVLLLYDVADAIALDEVRRILGLEPPGREPRFQQPAPEYVRFEQPPVVQVAEPVVLSTGERLDCSVRYYDYGVVSLSLELGFEAGWEHLIGLSSQWIASAELERRGGEEVRKRLARFRSALAKPTAALLSEDYYVFHVQGPPTTAAELIAVHGIEIAQIVRGESGTLSREECDEALQSRASYAPSDLLVAGWTAAFIYDTPPGAAPTLQLLEYANVQLLEFRHYDEVLTGVLNHVYRALDRGTGYLARWRLKREAERLNTIRLDVMELAERVDNSIKFLSDMFAARMYKLVAAKVGVPDYRRLVDNKLRTAGELYQFLVDQFNQGRAFVLELMIVVILIIDLVFLFRGKG